MIMVIVRVRDRHRRGAFCTGRLGMGVLLLLCIYPEPTHRVRVGIQRLMSGLELGL